MIRSPSKHLALVLLVAFAVRLGAVGWWQHRTAGQFVFGDSGGYWSLARAIATGKPYQNGPESRILRTPGYPILLAPIFLVDGREPSLFWGRALSAVFGTLAVAGVWGLARIVFGETAERRVPGSGFRVQGFGFTSPPMLAAWIAALYPGAIATSMLLLSEAPFCPVMLLHLILWVAAWKASSLGRASVLGFPAGLAAGAATLIRPSWLLFTPFALAVGLAFGKPRSRHLAVGLSMIAGLVVMMTPWVIRNARVSGHFVPTTLQVGASLYDGLNPTATGASDMRFVPAMTLAERNAPSDAVEMLEYRLDHRMRNEAIAWARQHPSRVVQLAAIKFVRIWNIWPNEATLSSRTTRLVIAVSYVPVMLLALVGAWRTVRRGWPYLLCCLPAVYFTLLHMIFVGSIRYRQPAMLALVVLAAGVVAGARKDEG